MVGQTEIESKKLISYKSKPCMQMDACGLILVPKGSQQNSPVYFLYMGSNRHAIFN